MVAINLRCEDALTKCGSPPTHSESFHWVKCYLLNGVEVASISRSQVQPNLAVSWEPLGKY